MTLYIWPPKTAHGRVIPKTRIYDGAGASRALQAKFVNQVERMEWTHVLRPDTLNLKTADGVAEVAVVAITLYKPDIDTAILAAIERAIPRPLVLELCHNARTRLCMAWKRPSLAVSGQWVTSPHFMGPWIAADTKRSALPPALDMATLYAALLDPLLPPRISETETLAERVIRAEEAARLEREATRLSAAIAREKQFNRKVELNAALKELHKKHAALLAMH
jgi:Domain of unknown function (DUF4391)